MPYAVQSDIENIFGVENVALWSNITPGTTQNAPANAARVALALQYADDTINEAMRNNGQYQIPLTLRGNAPGATMGLIVNCAATLAGAWLYKSRGMADATGPDGQPSEGKMYVLNLERAQMTWLKDVQKRKTGLPCTYIPMYSEQPRVMN